MKHSIRRMINSMFGDRFAEEVESFSSTGSETDFTGPILSVAQRRNLAAYRKMGCPYIPEGQDMAKLVLGDYFVSTSEAAEAHGWSYSDEQLADFSRTLPNFETLVWLRSENFLLVATPPTDHDVYQVQKILKGLCGLDFRGRETLPPLADTVVAGEWLAIRADEYPASAWKKFSAEQSDGKKSFTEQVAMLPPEEKVPNVTEAAYVFGTFRKVRGRRPFRRWDTCLTTSSADGDIAIRYCDNCAPSLYIFDGAGGLGLGITSSYKIFD